MAGEKERLPMIINCFLKSIYFNFFILHSFLQVCSFSIELRKLQRSMHICATIFHSDN